MQVKNKNVTEQMRSKPVSAASAVQLRSVVPRAGTTDDPLEDPLIAGVDEATVLSNSPVISKFQAAISSSNSIMMFGHGCTGTTPAFYILRDLIAAHHGKIASTGQGELIKNLDEASTESELRKKFWTTWDISPEENQRISGVLQATSLKDKFEIVYTAARTNNEIVVFKNELSEGEDHRDLMEYIHSIGTKAFLLLRRNVLDVLACRTRDFCDKLENQGLGTVIDEAGNDIGCEFRGRGEEELEEAKNDTSSVFLNTVTLLASLDSQMDMDGRHLKFLQNMGFADAEVFFSEGLFAFEYGEEYVHDGLAISTDHWQRLLLHVGIQPDEATIQDVLKNQSAYPAPKDHNEVFGNFDEIEQALLGTEYHDLLRMPAESDVRELLKSPIRYGNVYQLPI